MDETRLFYQLEANHSLVTKQLEGCKKDNERITIVVCCNDDGSDKVPLWVISKYVNLRCFKNVNMNNLSCHSLQQIGVFATVSFYTTYIGGKKWAFDTKSDGG